MRNAKFSAGIGRSLHRRPIRVAAHNDADHRFAGYMAFHLVLFPPMQIKPRASGVLNRFDCYRYSIDLQESTDGRILFLQPSHEAILLPLPARNERGEGWGEGFSSWPCSLVSPSHKTS